MDSNVAPRCPPSPASKICSRPTPKNPARARSATSSFEILKSHGEVLPSANSPRGKLWHLVNSPKSTLSDCTEVIQTDAALAARIMRVANSGAYGAQADNINQAIQHLGMKFVREQVYNTGVFKQYSGWELPPEWDQFWLRNIFVARLCEKISAVCGPTNGSEYLAGLIHDIGWLFLATNFAKEFSEIFATGQPIEEAEREFLPYGHAKISAAIAARSMMPPRAVAAILDHHHPLIPTREEKYATGGEADPLTFILKISDDIADACGVSMFGTPGWDIEQIQTGPEMLWLNAQGKAPGLEPIAKEELAKSHEIFNAYFTNKTFK